MDYYLGTILLLAYNGRIPYGLMLCNGNLLQIRQYNALFALLSNTYGGDGRTTFALPNMLGQEPQPGMNYYIAVTGIFPPHAD